MCVCVLVCVLIVVVKCLSQCVHPCVCILTFTMLNRYLSCFKNSVDPDQLASEKPADQDLHCFFHSAYKYLLITEIVQVR